MLTKLTLKLSLFAAAITFTYCVVTSVSLLESLSRSLVVLVGFYAILIVFFVLLRLIFAPHRQQEVEAITETDSSGEEDELEEDEEEFSVQEPGAEVSAIEKAGVAGE